MPVPLSGQSHDADMGVGQGATKLAHGHLCHHLPFPSLESMIRGAECAIGRLLRAAVNTRWLRCIACREGEIADHQSIPILPLQEPNVFELAPQIRALVEGLERTLDQVLRGSKAIPAQDGYGICVGPLAIVEAML